MYFDEFESAFAAGGLFFSALGAAVCCGCFTANGPASVVAFALESELACCFGGFADWALAHGAIANVTAQKITNIRAARFFIPHLASNALSDAPGLNSGCSANPLKVNRCRTRRIASETSYAI